MICRIVDEGTKEAAAVDPVEPEKVLEASNSLGLTIKFVLTTHHHWFVTYQTLQIIICFQNKLTYHYLNEQLNYYVSTYVILCYVMYKLFLFIVKENMGMFGLTYF